MAHFDILITAHGDKLVSLSSRTLILVPREDSRNRAYSRKKKDSLIDNSFSMAFGDFTEFYADES